MTVPWVKSYLKEGNFGKNWFSCANFLCLWIPSSQASQLIHHWKGEEKRQLEDKTCLSVRAEQESAGTFLLILYLHSSFLMTLGLFGGQAHLVPAQLGTAKQESVFSKYRCSWVRWLQKPQCCQFGQFRCNIYNSFSFYSVSCSGYF